MSTDSPVRTARTALLQELGSRLKLQGFPARPSGYSFRRKTAFGCVGVHLNIAQYETEFHAAVHISVRFDAVEEIMGACENLLSAAEKRKSVTFGCELGNLKEGRRREWRVAVGHSDLRKIASEMAQLVVEYGLPYFERYSSIAEVYDVFSSDDPKAGVHVAPPLWRGERAVAMAFVLGGPAEATRMIEAKRNYLRGQDPRYARLFERFVECFKKHVGIE